MTATTIAYDLETINVAAQALLKAISEYGIITLSGDLGAGKTTLVSHLCQIMHVQDAVSSPTFSLVNEYLMQPDSTKSTMPLYHIDWYRLRDANEAMDAGMEDYLIQANNGEAWCIIEWPEKASELLTMPHIAATISVTGPYSREIVLTTRP